MAFTFFSRSFAGEFSNTWPSLLCKSLKKVDLVILRLSKIKFVHRHGAPSSGAHQFSALHQPPLQLGAD
jgi:hypothetical protein